MSTFKVWMIANLGIMFFAVTALMSLLTFLFHGVNESNIVIIFAFLALIVAEIFEAPNTIWTFLCCVAFLLAQLFFVIKLASVSVPLVLLNIAFLVLGVYNGIKVGSFTQENFYDMVSRRVQWQNSTVDMFEVKWKYVFNRFALSVALTYMFLIEVVILFSPKAGTTMLQSLSLN